MRGTPEDFALWLEKVNENLKPFNLRIDKSSVGQTNSFILFLDIQFCFDSEGDLQTDLYVEPTDSRSYLNFGTAHPKHIFSGILGCFCLRRIINNQDRLKLRLEELKKCFQNAGYPDSLIDNSVKKALSSERSLERRIRTNQEERCIAPSICIVSTYGGDLDIVGSVKKFESVLMRTRSFSESDIADHKLTLPRASTPTCDQFLSPNMSIRTSRSQEP